MILEGLVTTLNDDGSPRISPMGPIVNGEISELVLRPFRSSLTFRNLKRSPQGVFHITDDVELLARAAVHRIESIPDVRPARGVQGVILVDACRWYAFEVSHLDDRGERARIECAVVDRGRHRDFVGFNRAKHAVVEAAILATRLELIPADEIHAEFRRLAVIVDKTAGDQERGAFAFLDNYVRQAMQRSNGESPSSEGRIT